MLCWRMLKLSWTDRVRNEELLHRVKEDRRLLDAIKRRQADWIGRTWRVNCLLENFVEGKMEVRIQVTGRRGRRRKQLLDDLREKRSYWNLKEEALDRKSGELALEGAVDLLYDTQENEWMDIQCILISHTLNSGQRPAP